MLGINEIHETIRAPFAKQMRDSLRRANTGRLNEKELLNIEKEEALSRLFTSVWA